MASKVVVVVVGFEKVSRRTPPEMVVVRADALRVWASRFAGRAAGAMISDMG